MVMIRNFAKEDLPQVLDLCREVRQYHNDLLHGYFAEQNDEYEKGVFLETLENNEDVALVAEEGDEIVGVLLGEFKTSRWLKNSRVAHISNLGIKKDYRRKGVGRQLMDCFFELCKNRKIQEIRLGVYIDNVPAYKFYEDYGFRPLQQTMTLDLTEK